MQCDLTRIRPITNRTQIAIRRQLEVRVTQDPPPKTWWQASTIGGFDRTRFDLVPRGGATALATATIWRIEPIALTWGLTAAGLIGLSVVESRRRQGLATYLLGETFRQLRAGGVTLVEAQIRQENTAALGLYQRLGFADVDRGSVFQKVAPGCPPADRSG
jgi:GNAT superfamily N-acetyltransferase